MMRYIDPLSNINESRIIPVETQPSSFSFGEYGIEFLEALKEMVQSNNEVFLLLQSVHQTNTQLFDLSNQSKYIQSTKPSLTQVSLFKELAQTHASDPIIKIHKEGKYIRIVVNMPDQAIAAKFNTMQKSLSLGLISQEQIINNLQQNLDTLQSNLSKHDIHLQDVKLLALPKSFLKSRNRKKRR